MNPSVGAVKSGRLWLTVFVIASALYLLTCLRGPAWQDSGMIQYRVMHSDMEGKLGLALAHPLFYRLTIAGTKVLPGDMAFRINTVSALFGAIAAANLFLLVYTWLRELWPAIIATGSLALSHTFWQHAALPETYNLYLALLLGELIVLLHYSRTQDYLWLYLLALLNGLAIANHMLASIPAACYVVLVIYLLSRRQLPVRHIGVMALCWIIGALPYEMLILREIIEQGNVAGPLASALFGNSYHGDVMNTAITGRIIKENILFLLMNFPTYNLLLVIPGIFAIRRLAPQRWLGWMVLGLTVLFFAFAFRYTVPDRYAFFLPFYAMLALLIGLGAHEFLRHKHGLGIKVILVVGLLLPVGAYLAAPAMAKQAGIHLGTRRTLPFRDDYRYFLQPWKHNDHSAECFAQIALVQVEPEAIIYADNTTVYSLLYMQEAKEIRPDVRVVSGHVRTPGAEDLSAENVKSALAQGTEIYVVTPQAGYCPEFLADNYSFELIGALHRVRGK